MANNFDSNVTRKLARIFLEKFESSRVLCKTVDTQLLQGRFTPSSGTTVDFKRPHDYKSISTTGGDISSSTKSDIVSGKATGTVQNFITVAADYNNIDEAIKMDQLDQILAPMATRVVTDLELKLGEFMINNLGLSYGSVGTATDAWGDVAGAGAWMDSLGVPKDGEWYYVMNPFVNQALANTQSGLSSGSNKLVDTAWEKAQISENFGGMRVLTSNALKTRTNTTAADLAGTITGTPDVTYATHKDTMKQTIGVTGFTAAAVVKAGSIVEITGKTHVSLSTRETILDASGAAVKFRGVVTADVTLGTAGEGNLVVAGPAIYEATGAYNTTSSAIAASDVITILGTSGATLQPNLFYHGQAIGLGTVKLPKLHSTDTVATTEDGMSIRVSRYSDGDKNQQSVRFDLLPAFACFNPFFGGQGYGVA
jgi:hypothetical protein